MKSGMTYVMMLFGRSGQKQVEERQLEQFKKEIKSAEEILASTEQEPKNACNELTTPPTHIHPKCIVNSPQFSLTFLLGTPVASTRRRDTQSAGKSELNFIKENAMYAFILFKLQLLILSPWK
jgi:hypothetical protein